MGPIQLSSANVSHTFIGYFSANELNELAGPSLFNSYKSTNSNLEFIPTSRGVSLYRITYPINLLSGLQMVSGLVVIPDELVNDPAATLEGQPRQLPLAMYNHGTVFSQNEVPSQVLFQDINDKWRVGSGETLLDLCRLTDAGYALIAPDYIGLGINHLQEGYSVKDVANVAMLGMVEASRSVFADLNIKPSQLFLNGWSLGAFNTQWLAQELQNLAIPVAASAVAAPMNNWLGLFKWANTLNPIEQNSESGGFGINPYNPAPWLPLSTGMAIASYEYWYALDGLFDVIIKDKVIPDRQFNINGNIIDDPSSYAYSNNPDRLTYRQVIREFINNYQSIRFPPDGQFSNLIWNVGISKYKFSEQGSSNNFIWTTVPGFTSKEMLVDGLFDQPQHELIEEFKFLLGANTPQDFNYQTPLRAWYGTGDEALPADLVNPDMAAYGGLNVSIVPVTDASHRETFLNALFASSNNQGGTSENLIDWFEGFRKPDLEQPSLQLVNNSLQVISGDFGLLPVLIEATQQLGERPLHIQILRIRKDDSAELIGSLGGTTAKAGQLQFLGRERVLLQVGERLGFQLLDRDDNSTDIFTTEIRPKVGGAGFDVVLKDDNELETASLQFAVTTSPSQFSSSMLDRIAAPQAGVADGLLQLTAGQTINLTISSDSSFVNTLSFVRLNLDPITGLPLNSAGDRSININSADFGEIVLNDLANAPFALDELLDAGFEFSQGGRTVSSTLQWDVTQSGIYAPVLITPEGNVFCGAPGSIDQQMRRLGQNRFGFEDLKGDLSDYDWNDVVVDVDIVQINMGPPVKSSPPVRFDNAINGNDLPDTTLEGTKLNDFITFGVQTASAYGRDGDDLFQGSDANNYFWPGNGNDTVYAATGSDWIDARLDVPANLDKFYGQDGNDYIYGGAGAEFIDGGDGIDFIDSGAGKDVIRGGNGNDQIVKIGLGTFNILGDAGDDNIKVVSADSGTINGGPGNDLIEVSGLIEGVSVYAMSGDDVVKFEDIKHGSYAFLGDGNNQFFGVNVSKLQITASSGNDTVTLRNSKDITIDLGNGNNNVDLIDCENITVITGSGGSNFKVKSSKNITLKAGRGSDYFNVDAASFKTGTIKLDGGYMYNTDPEKNGGERNKLTIDNLEAGDKLIFNDDSFSNFSDLFFDHTVRANLTFESQSFFGLYRNSYSGVNFFTPSSRSMDIHNLNDKKIARLQSEILFMQGTKPFNPVPVGYIGTMYAASWYSSNNDNRLVFVHGSSYNTQTSIGFGDVTENIFDPYSNFGGMNTVVDEVAGNLKVSWIR